MGSNPESPASGEAYALYQSARSKWNQRTPGAIRDAIRLLERAIALDGTFALACAALADCYSILLEYGILAPREGLTAARLAAGRALHRGPELAESLTAAALVRQMDMDWSSAEAEFRAAIRAHPSYAVARQRFALFLAWMGRTEESIEEIEVARKLDPDSAAIAASTAWIEYYSGDFKAALLVAEDAGRRFPGFTSASAVHALSMIQAGAPRKAIRVLERALVGEAENVSLASLLSYAHASAGDRKAAEAQLEDLRSGTRRGYVSPYYLAVPQVALGRHQEALSQLQAARSEGAPQLVYLVAEPIFRPIRSEAGFQTILNAIGLPYHGAKASPQTLVGALQTPPAAAQPVVSNPPAFSGDPLPREEAG